MNSLLFLAESSEVATEQTQLEVIISKILTWCLTSGVKIVIGLIGLFILFKIINFIAKKVKNNLEKRKHDRTITNVIYHAIKKGLKAILFILFLGYVGIDTAGIGSIIASCAVAVGLALQGSLANLAGWFIIIVMRPIRLGDYVSCQGCEGTVEDINLFYTYINTVDNKVIMIPNGSLSNGNITNYSIKKTRRVDQVFQISYVDDVNKAINVIKDVISKHEKILKDPEAFVRMSNLDSSSINISSKVWVKQEDYWTVYFDLLQQVKEAFDENNITVPYNQLDVHISNN